MYLKILTVCGFTAYVTAEPPTIEEGITIENIVPVKDYDPHHPEIVPNPKSIELLSATTTATEVGSGAFGRCYLVNFTTSTGEVTQAVLKVMDLKDAKDRSRQPTVLAEFEANHFFSAKKPHPAIMKAYGMKVGENHAYLLLALMEQFVFSTR